MKKAFASIILLTNFLAVFALILSYLAVVIPPDKFWIPAFFGMAYPFVVTANILFILFWLFVKPRYSLLSLIFVVAGFGLLSRYFQVAGKNLEEGGIKVLSYNVRHFEGYEKGEPKDNAEKIVDFLNEQEPDIICFQETRLRRNTIFNLANTVKQLKSIEHYHYARSGSTYGLVTMTRYPIIKMNEIRFENSGNMAISTDVIIKKDTVRIFNVHLQSYKIDPRKYSIIESPGIDEEKDIKEMRDMGKKLATAFVIRAKQARDVKNQITKSPYPVIVCGDFNDTPVSYAYQTMRGDFIDAFISSGKGFGQTYVGKLPSFRIDNIFHSPQFESYNFKTYGFKMSDHLPVSCSLVLQQN